LASIISSALLNIEALPIEIFRPIDQFGWARADMPPSHWPSARASMCGRGRTGGRQDDALDRMVLVVFERLEDGAVFAVDRDQPSRRLRLTALDEEFAGRDEAFLVGKRDIGASFARRPALAQGRPCRRSPPSPSRTGMRGGLDQRLRGRLAASMPVPARASFRAA
jgi:hypothetical protein